MAFSFNGLTSEVTISGAVNAEPTEKTIIVTHAEQAGLGTSIIYTCPAAKKAYIIGLSLGSRFNAANSEHLLKLNGVVAIATTGTNTITSTGNASISFDYKLCPKLAAAETAAITIEGGTGVAFATIFYIEEDA